MKSLLICGGVGGAKLAYGFYNSIPHDAFDVLVNTGDDFIHLGLHVSPDLDTVIYTLSEEVEVSQGWGRQNESWNMLNELRTLEGDIWFQLGDKDLATHFIRTSMLNDGKSLTDITAHIASRFGIKSNIFPMSDNLVSTFIKTDRDILSFQEYFVKHRCLPIANDFIFKGSSKAKLNSKINLDDYDNFIICPSNPFISIGPILSIKKISDHLKANKDKVFVISPIVDGDSIKGPTAKIFRELGHEPSVKSVAEFYQDYATNIFIDNKDSEYLKELNSLGFNVFVDRLVMKSKKSKVDLAKSIVEYLSR